jgi:hypothetical protein
MPEPSEKRVRVKARPAVLGRVPTGTIERHLSLALEQLKTDSGRAEEDVEFLKRAYFLAGAGLTCSQIASLLERLDGGKWYRNKSQVYYAVQDVKSIRAAMEDAR